MKTFLLAVCWAVCGFAQPNGFDSSAKSVWPKGLEEEMNTLVAFRTEFAAKDSDDVRLDLAAWYSYRVTLNGSFVAFGPARGPKGYFQYMADRTGTLWENDTICASCCHGFASYAAVLLVRSVLGVEKVDLVSRTVTVRDTDVDLDFCEAELPTPDGMLSVAWRKVGGGKKRKASAPEGWRIIER